MNKICFGCGAKLQFEDESKEGYIPREKYDDSKYCRRCFRMIHYGVVQKDSEPKSISSIVENVNKNAKHVVFMVDFINIFDDVMNIFKKIKVPKTLVISKSDIIPKNISYNQIREYLNRIYHVKSEIIFTSMKSNLNTLTKSLYGKDEIYFLGLTNAGKSTLLNSLLEKKGGSSKALTTSYKENTTKEFIRLKVGNMTLVDSPGFALDNFELDKDTNIKEEIKPITYQQKTKCTYDIGGLFEIAIASPTTAVFYFSKRVQIKRLYNKNTIGTTFKIRGNSDIVICGLGFIKITDTTEITMPQDMMKYMNVRPSITGGVYEQN